MKKLIIIFVLIPLLSIAQEVQKVEVVKSDTQIENLNKLLGQNEIKIDFLDFIIFPALTLGYEKNRNSSTAYGATMFINFDTDLGSEWNDKFAITPYYRFYFYNLKITEVMVCLLKSLLSFRQLKLRIIQMQNQNLTLTSHQDLQWVENG